MLNCDPRDGEKQNMVHKFGPWFLTSLSLICQIYPYSGRKKNANLFFSNYPLQVTRLKFWPPGNSEVDRRSLSILSKLHHGGKGGRKPEWWWRGGLKRLRHVTLPSPPPPPHHPPLYVYCILYTTHSKRLNTPM
jgi:hypothetical protein